MDQFSVSDSLISAFWGRGAVLSGRCLSSQFCYLGEMFFCRFKLIFLVSEVFENLAFLFNSLKFIS